MGRIIDALIPWSVSLSCAALALSVLGLVIWWVQKRRIRGLMHQHEQLQQTLAELTQRAEKIKSNAEQVTCEFNELRSGELALVRRVALLEQALAELAQRQVETEVLDPERKLYSRAVRMVELGADLDEVMQECELPRAEAELIVNLHRQKHS